MTHDIEKATAEGVQEERDLSSLNEEERAAHIESITYEGDFEEAMTKLVEATLAFAPITVNRGNYEIVRDARVLEAMFAELLNGRNEFAYMIPTKYGIRDKMSEIFKAAYLNKYGITIGPERTATIEEVEQVISQAEDLS